MSMRHVDTTFNGAKVTRNDNQSDWREPPTCMEAIFSVKTGVIFSINTANDDVVL